MRKPPFQAIIHDLYLLQFRSVKKDLVLFRNWANSKSIFNYFFWKRLGNIVLMTLKADVGRQNLLVAKGFKHI